MPSPPSPTVPAHGQHVVVPDARVKRGCRVLHARTKCVYTVTRVDTRRQCATLDGPPGTRVPLPQLRVVRPRDPAEDTSLAVTLLAASESAQSADWLFLNLPRFPVQSVARVDAASYWRVAAATPSKAIDRHRRQGRYYVILNVPAGHPAGTTSFPLDERQGRLNLEPRVDLRCASRRVPPPARPRVGAAALSVQ